MPSVVSDKIATAKIKQRRKATPKEAKEPEITPEPQISEIPVRKADMPKPKPEAIPVEVAKDETPNPPRAIKSKVLGMRDLPQPKKLPDPIEIPKEEPQKPAEPIPEPVAKPAAKPRKKQEVIESDSESSDSSSDSEEAVVFKIKGGKKSASKKSASRDDSALISEIAEMRRLMEEQSAKMDKLKKKTKKVKEILYNGGPSVKIAPPEPPKPEFKKPATMDPALIRSILRF